MCDKVLSVLLFTVKCFYIFVFHQGYLQFKFSYRNPYVELLITKVYISDNEQIHKFELGNHKLFDNIVVSVVNRTKVYQRQILFKVWYFTG